MWAAGIEGTSPDRSQRREDPKIKHTRTDTLRDSLIVFTMLGGTVEFCQRTWNNFVTGAYKVKQIEKRIINYRRKKSLKKEMSV